MRFIRTLAALALAVCATLTFTAAPAQAQATRTWVSGVGDDVNPCSRTAPCKTFAGAISKTSAGGEINCLDPAGYGAVTITKSITIDCEDTQGSILGSSTNGVNINDSASGFPNTIKVILRGLSINGASTAAQNAQGNPGTGLVGVNFTSGASLLMEKMIIQNFNAGTAVGVRVAPGGVARVTLSDVTITKNGTGATGGGILVQPTGAGGLAVLIVEDSEIVGNTNNGLSVNTTGNTNAGGTSVSIDNSRFSNNTGNGVIVTAPAGNSPVAMMVKGSTMSINGTGLAVTGPGGSIRVGDTSISGNATGLSIAGGSFIQTYGTNRVFFNGTNGAFTGAIIPQD